MTNLGKKEKKVRLDVLVVEKGLAETRQKAQALILAGQILSGDRLLDKPGIKLDAETDLRVRGEVSEYVSRGALKLIGAIEEFKIDLTDTICADFGASTGGFTQVCLKNGAKKVYAIDVGHNQLHWKIRNDSRVVVLEKVNLRDELRVEDVIDFICIDVSFISLKLILPTAVKACRLGASIIALIKPQHEVGKEQVGKGGVVRDPALHDQVNSEIARFAQSIGLKVCGLIESPIKGTTGNAEFLIYLKNETHR